MRLFILMAILALSPLAAEENNTHFLTVTGEGQVSVKANIADVQVGIQVHRKTANDVQQELAAKLKPVLEQLRSLHADKIETGSMQIFPEYDKDNSQKLIGYKGLITVQFSTDFSNAGELIDAAIEAGANEINNISLRPSKVLMEEALLQALVFACDNALLKANAILKALKLENKGIIEISSEQASPGPYTRHYKTEMAMAEPMLEITEQEQTITAHITLKIEID